MEQTKEQLQAEEQRLLKALERNPTPYQTTKYEKQLERVWESLHRQGLLITSEVNKVE
jgi:hypothetical protein